VRGYRGVPLTGPLFRAPFVPFRGYGSGRPGTVVPGGDPSRPGRTKPSSAGRVGRSLRGTLPSTENRSVRRRNF